jgi:hypothetical protein
MIKDNNDGTFSIVVPCSFDKPKPVAWMYEVNDTFILFSANKPPEDAYDEGSLVPLYTTPRELSDELPSPVLQEYFEKGYICAMESLQLSDEEIREVAKKHLGHSMGLLNWHSFAKAILKKASEK